MDAEALNIVLKLQEENVLLHRVINDAEVMLHNRKKYLTLQSGIPDAGSLMLEVYDILSDFDKIQQPTNGTGNHNDCSDNSVDKLP